MTESVGGAMAEAASVCLDEQGHGNAADLIINGAFQVSFRVERLTVTRQMKLTHNDLPEATENGACGVAILTIRELTGLTVVDRSAKGTGFDYWLGSETDGLPFSSKARLEVSGIMKGTLSDIKTRVKQKLEQTKASDGYNLPAYIVIVEFSKPTIQVAQK